MTPRQTVADEIAEAITNAAFEVVTDTDGHRSIHVHPRHEGMMEAAEIARHVGGLENMRSSADVLLHLESWLRTQYHHARRHDRETGEVAFAVSSAIYDRVLDKLSDLRGGAIDVDD